MLPWKSRRSLVSAETQLIMSGNLRPAQIADKARGIISKALSIHVNSVLKYLALKGNT